MNEMNKGDILWKCPNCGRLETRQERTEKTCKHVSIHAAPQCVCGTLGVYFTTFMLDRGDEIGVTRFEKRLATLNKHEVYSMGYNDGFAATSLVGNELKYWLRRYE